MLVDSVIKQVETALPETKEVYYDFERRGFYNLRTGSPVRGEIFEEASDSRAARAAKIGPGTIRQAIILKSILQGEHDRGRSLRTLQAILDGHHLLHGAENAFYQEVEGGRQSGRSSEEEPLGSYDPETRTIALLKSANASTPYHETGHWALDIYGKIAADPASSPDLRADMGAILNWMDVPEVAGRRGAARFSALTRENPTARLAAVKAEVAKIIEKHGLEEMPNAKTGGKGAELYTGHSEVNGSVDRTIGEAQNSIKSAQPEEINSVNRSETYKAWASALAGQSRGIAARVAEGRGGVREKDGRSGGEAESLARPAAEPRNAGEFRQPDELRLAQHRALAEKEGLKNPEAFQPHTFRDNLTKWFTDRERIATIERAQDYLDQHPDQDATYAAADVGNLGGLNEVLGRENADEVFKAIANIFSDHLHKLGGDVVLIRHGGDEFSAIVVGADKEAVSGAMDAARREVAQYVHSKGLETLPHSKEPDNPDRAGVGMYTATDEIAGRGGKSAKEVIDYTDKKIELAKGSQKAEAQKSMGSPIIAERFADKLNVGGQTAQAAKLQQQPVTPTGHPLLDAEQWAKYQKELQAMSPENRAIAERFADKLRDYDAAVAEYAQLHDSQGGKVLNTDIARELSPGYLADRTKSEVVQRLASAFVRKMYADKLAATKKPKVLFSAGGPGSGKSTVLGSHPQMESDADIVYDTTMSDYRSAKGMLQQVLDAGGSVRVALIIREPADALLKGVISRAVKEERKYGSGRTVSLEYFLQAHPSAIRNVFRLAEEYRGNPDVRFTYMDNTHGFGKSREISPEQARKIEFQQVEERARAILEQEYRDGRIRKKIYTGIKFGKDVP